MAASTRLNHWLLLGLAAVAIWLPRGLQLGRYVTDDEQKWLARSANFYWALDHADFAATRQREHPGVTVMWAGALGFLWRYADYVHDAPGLVDWGDNEMDKIVRAHGQQPLQLLAAGRAVLVLAITLTLALALRYAMALLGTKTALVGFGLLAFDPFHIALSRLLHLDGLVSSLMLLAVLAFLAFLQHENSSALLVSAAAAGLAWLTKTPAFFLIPLIGLTALLYQRSALFNRKVWRAQLLRFVWPLLGWGLIALAVYVIGWPAMWVQPLRTLRYVFSESLAYATGTHVSQIYFNGRVLSGDPGLLFYPLVYLWRSTPVIWIGLLLAVLELFWSRANPPLEEPSKARSAREFTLAILLLFAVSYGLLITVGAKKLDRYLLPIFAPLDLVAALGWLGLANRVRLQKRSFKTSFALPVLLTVPLIWQAGLALNTFPYFLTYFNPWLGGLAKASHVLMLGRGEGLDLVAAYLNAKPEAATLKTLVTSTDNLVYSSQGPLVTTSFIKNSEMPTREKMLRWLTLDTAVIYVNDWQRQVAPPAFLDFFASLQPEQRIRINNFEYARIYNLRQSPVPPFLAAGAPGYITWGQAIRLAAYELPTTSLKVGERFTTLFYLQNVGPIAHNLNEKIRVVGPNNHEVAKVDGWPWGAPTSTWQRYDVWPDGHEFTIPTDTPAGSYRVELSFYEPVTFDHLVAVDLRTRQTTSDPVVIAELKVIEQ
ncbi:MAG: glycosyltransferase family 39 protein [Chloroflexi bacterium]|nr:glycosyltransferase family 39 protein [Chloroflexota bacterium]